MYKNITTCVTVKRGDDLITYAFTSRDDAITFVQSFDDSEFLVHKPDTPIAKGLNSKKVFYTIVSISLCAGLGLLGTEIVKNVQDIVKFQEITNCKK